MDKNGAEHHFFLRPLLCVIFLDMLSLSTWVPEVYKSESFAAPLSFFHLFPTETLYPLMLIFLFLTLVTSGLGAFGFLNRHIIYSGAFFLFALNALRNSSGGIASNNLFAIWALIFLCLGRGTGDRAKPELKNFGVWMAIFSVCIFYCMSSFHKIEGAFACLFDENALCINDSTFFANLVAKEFNEFWRKSILGTLIFKHEALFNFSYFGALLTEFVTVLIPFLPRLQRYWAFVLFLVHAFVELFLGIHFMSGPVVAMGMLALTPFGLQKNLVPRFPDFSKVKAIAPVYARAFQVLALLNLAVIFYRASRYAKQIGILQLAGGLEQVPLINYVYSGAFTLAGLHSLAILHWPRSKTNYWIYPFTMTLFLVLFQSWGGLPFDLFYALGVFYICLFTAELGADSRLVRLQNFIRSKPAQVMFLGAFSVNVLWLSGGYFWYFYQAVVFVLVLGVVWRKDRVA